MSPPTLILLVDDQPIVAAAMRRLLVPTDFELRHCVDPRQAVGEVEAHLPAVVIVDLVMPGLGGLEVTRQLRGNPTTATIPIMALSSIDEPLMKAEALDVGADDYLIKIPDPIELAARLRALLRRSRWSKTGSG